MAVALRPGDFRGGLTAPGGAGWQIGDEIYDTNPRLLLTSGDIAMIRVWRLARGGGYGSGHLPDAGGTLDQAAVMLDAFDAMDAAEAEFRAQWDELTRGRRR